MPTSKCIGMAKRRCGLIIWLAVACLAWLTSACGSSVPPTPGPTPQPGTLRLDVLPAGATALIDGKERGRTPLTLELPAGSYALAVREQGYAALQQAVWVKPGEETLVSEALRDIAVPAITWGALPDSLQVGQVVTLSVQATDNQDVTHMLLWIDRQLVTETEGSTLIFVLPTETLAEGPHSLIAQAEDGAGNTGQDERSVEVRAAPPPRPSPTPIVAVSSPDVVVRETTVSLMAYPYPSYLKSKSDPAFGFSPQTLDRTAYEAANPRPQAREFRAVVLENEYLRLTFLPELGGRLYSCLFKPSGQELFYHNTVLKPSYWGPFSREENWWLAIGGLEWDLPVNEHGYEWGQTWSYQIEQGPHTATIVLRDSQATDRLCAEIRVTLSAGSALFKIEPRFMNPTAGPVTCQVWLNAALTLGSAKTSPGTEFVYPTPGGQMIVHSTGDGALPREKQLMSWPVYDGRDLSRYGNWRNWLGVFVPDAQQDWVGVYNHDTELGVARVFPHTVARGLKLFALGSDFPARAEYCDDGSDYFEMWGGPCRTFWPEDDITINAGEALTWSEVWLPFSQIQGLDVANTDVALATRLQDGRIHAGVAVSAPCQIQIRLSWNDVELTREMQSAAPDKPLLFEAQLPPGAVSPGHMRVQLLDERGATLLEYTEAITF